MFRIFPFWVGIGLLVAAGSATPTIAQAACAPLPPPSGPTIEVFPAQASGLRGIVAAAATGTTILLHDGLWAMDQGDSTSRVVFATPGVTLRSVSGNRDAVVLDGGYNTNELISIYASNVTIADLTLRRAWEHPIHLSGNAAAITGARLHNLRIVDPGEQAIKINPGSAVGFVDDGVIECSHLELTDVGRGFVRNNCYTGGIDGHQAWGWQVRRNRIEGFWCATGLSEHAIHFWTGSRDTLIEENVIVDNARGVGLGLGSSGAGRTYPDNPYPGVGYLGHIDGIVRNNFVAAASPALFASQYGFDAGIALEQARGAIVAHNTVASTAAPFSSIEWRFANTVVELLNNLVTHNLRERDGNPQATLAGNISAAPTATSPTSRWATSTSSAMRSRHSVPASCSAPESPSTTSMASRGVALQMLGPTKRWRRSSGMASRLGTPRLGRPRCREFLDLAGIRYPVSWSSPPLSTCSQEHEVGSKSLWFGVGTEPDPVAWSSVGHRQARVKGSLRPCLRLRAQHGP